MDNRLLMMKWSYTYDKESTWFDEDSGEEQYALTEGARYVLPHLSPKSLVIRAVKATGDIVQAEIYVDYKTYTVCTGGDPVVAHAYHEYSAGGDSVSQTLCMHLTII